MITLAGAEMSSVVNLAAGETVYLPCAVCREDSIGTVCASVPVKGIEGGIFTTVRLRFLKIRGNKAWVSTLVVRIANESEVQIKVAGVSYPVFAIVSALWIIEQKLKASMLMAKEGLM